MELPDVSVPYLSGQALQYEFEFHGDVELAMFQSPICRGRRCNRRGVSESSPRIMFQSPICRGRRCNLRGGEFTAPLHAFQSPICRGRRCNNPMVPCARPTCSRFQSPICRGRRCNSTKRG